MRQLHLALFAEGPTDHRFLGELLRRLADDICRRRADHEVGVPTMIELHTPAQSKGRPRARRIVDAVESVGAQVDVLFVHADADSDAQRALSERAMPGIDLAQGQPGWPHLRGVPVIPVRATEAWCLVDGDAVRRVFGTSKSDEALGLPSPPRRAEELSEPKAVWQAVVRTALPRRSRSGAGMFYGPIAARASLDRLRELRAFQRCEHDLTAALEALGYLRY